VEDGAAIVHQQDTEHSQKFLMIIIIAGIAMSNALHQVPPSVEIIMVWRMHMEHGSIMRSCGEK